jgi:hypothetical protein
MNPWGKLCQVINLLRRSFVVIDVVNPALFQTDCARFILVAMKLGTWHCLGVGVGVGDAVGAGVVVGDGAGVGVG